MPLGCSVSLLLSSALLSELNAAEAFHTILAGLGAEEYLETRAAAQAKRRAEVNMVLYAAEVTTGAALQICCLSRSNPSEDTCADFDHPCTSNPSESTSNASATHVGHFHP